MVYTYLYYYLLPVSLMYQMMTHYCTSPTTHVLQKEDSSVNHFVSNSVEYKNNSEILPHQCSHYPVMTAQSLHVLIICGIWIWTCCYFDIHSCREEQIIVYDAH